MAAHTSAGRLPRLDLVRATRAPALRLCVPKPSRPQQARIDYHLCAAPQAVRALDCELARRGRVRRAVGHAHELNLPRGTLSSQPAI